MIQSNTKQKTITVGTQRIQYKDKTYNFKSTNYSFKNINNFFYNKKLSNFFLKQELNINKKKNIFFFSEDVDETIIYFGVNYLNNYSLKI